MSRINVGFIGLGNMGFAMARCLPKNKDLIVTVFDMNKEAVEKMVALGTRAASSSREVAAASDVIISMVRDEPQNDEIIFGKNGVWEGVKKGAILAISSTVSPEYIQGVYQKGKEKGVHVIDAQVSDPSGPPHYLVAQLTFMMGGDEDDVKKCMPVYETMGKNLFYMGPIGTGATCKLINNLASFHLGTRS